MQIKRNSIDIFYKLTQIRALGYCREQFGALLVKAKKVDSKVEDDIKHLIKEGKKIYAKEKLNILVNDCYGYKVARIFERDDFLTNFEDSKKLCKALKLATEAIEKNEREI